MKGHVLHPIQFEELFARFHYSDYILQYSPEYKIKDENNRITIEIETTGKEPIFGLWNNDIFSQLLSNYWQVYGIEKEEILRFQKPPISFIENPYTKDFIKPESIDLPF
jgi:hypothetical protein